MDNPDNKEKAPINIPALYEKWKRAILNFSIEGFDEAKILGKQLLDAGETAESLSAFGDALIQNLPPEAIREAQENLPGLSFEMVQLDIKFRVDVILGREKFGPDDEFEDLLTIKE